MKRIKAFSLIELSIVILIIGILIAGVVQASRLVAQMRLASARTQTQSSPVPSITGLALWIDAVSQASFADADASNDQPINSWSDINPTSLAKTNFTALTTARPLYKDSAINGLPAVSFDGTNDIMSATTYDAVAGYQPSTIFAVIKNGVIPAGNTRIIGFTNSGYSLACGASGNALVTVWGVQDAVDTGGACNSLSTLVISISATTSASYPVLFYKNGALVSTVVSNGMAAAPSGTMTLGALNTPGEYYNGMIAEIIIYNRLLKTEERQAVEKYLGKKWGVKI